MHNTILRTGAALGLITLFVTSCVVSSPGNTGGSNPPATVDPAVVVEASKMNVLYVGVSNPLHVRAVGVPVSELEVAAEGMELAPDGSGKYVARTAKPGTARMIVGHNGKELLSKEFRVKRLPDPVARLSNKSGGYMGSGEFKAQAGVGAYLQNFDFDAVCQIVGFELFYIAKRQDAVRSINNGARYNAKSSRLIRNAKPGDIYFFNQVRARCPGDVIARPINSMAFFIQ